jgi:hypothetical protein
MVNGCVRSRASSEHTDPHSNYWNEVDQRLAAASVTGRQVLTLWIKEVIPGAVGVPDKAKELAKNLTETFTWCTVASPMRSWRISPAEATEAGPSWAAAPSPARMRPASP